MSLLATITSGVTRTGLRCVIGGLEKMGKTTLCSQMPAPLLIPCEVGFSGVSIAKTAMVQSWESLISLIDNEITPLAQAGQFPYRTLAFDSATAIERHLHDHILRRDPSYNPNGGKKSVTMESAHGGYGKAYNLANAEFDDLLMRFDNLAVYGGINIVMTCHVFASKMVDPTAGEYDQWDLLLHSPKNHKTYGKRERISQWADVIGFMYEPVFVAGSGDKGMARATSQNKGRVIGLSRTPGYVAGNRFGITGEIQLPAPPQNGWNSVADALHKSAGIDVYTR